jgi:hypothetical protein
MKLKTEERCEVAKILEKKVRICSTCPKLTAHLPNFLAGIFCREFCSNSLAEIFVRFFYFIETSSFLSRNSKYIRSSGYFQSIRSMPKFIYQPFRQVLYRKNYLFAAMGFAQAFKFYH